MDRMALSQVEIIKNSFKKDIWDNIALVRFKFNLIEKKRWRLKDLNLHLEYEGVLVETLDASGSV